MSIRRFVTAITLVFGAVMPVSAQQNAYGGHDIVARTGDETVYGTARNWTVFAARSGAGLAYCAAETVRSDGVAVRVGWDGLQWQLAVPVASPPDWQGTLEIDGAGSGQGYGSGGADISGTAQGGWTIAWLGLAELDGLQKGRVAVLGAGRGDFDFALDGSAAAILKVEECVSRGGAATAALPSVEPMEAEVVQVGTHGDWAISEIRAGGRVVACAAQDSVQPTLRFEIDRDNAYIDFRDGSAMGGPGARVSVMVGFGPGDTPMPYDIDIIEGRDGNAWGRLTEGRLDGPGLIDDSFQNATQVSFQGPGIILERGLFGSSGALDALFRCSDAIR